RGPLRHAAATAAEHIVGRLLRVHGVVRRPDPRAVFERRKHDIAAQDFRKHPVRDRSYNCGRLGAPDPVCRRAGCRLVRTSARCTSWYADAMTCFGTFCLSNRPCPDLLVVCAADIFAHPPGPKLLVRRTAVAPLGRGFGRLATLWIWSMFSRDRGSGRL